MKFLHEKKNTFFCEAGSDKMRQIELEVFMSNLKMAVLFGVVLLQVQNASAFFYHHAPVYKGEKIVNSTSSVEILKDFVHAPKEESYETYVTQVYFNESHPGVPAKFSDEAYSGYCMFDYVDANSPKVAKGSYFVKRDWVMPAQYPDGLWYREIYFGWTRNIRVLCEGSKEKMLSKDYVNRLMKGYVRLR